MKTVPARLVALAAGLVVLIASGCGGGKPAASATATGDANSQAMVAYAQCIRSHGVPNFPDPTGGKMVMRDNNGKMTVNGVALNVNSTQFQAAQQACRSKLPESIQAGSGNAQLQQKALAFAKCMREHGVTDFPDPKVTGGSIELPLNKNEAQSPKFQAAQKACNGILPGGK